MTPDVHPTPGRPLGQLRPGPIAGGGSAAVPGVDRRPAGHERASAQEVVIDCDVCSVRGSGCGDCMVTVLLGGPPEGVRLDDDERRALDVLAAAGLIPPLRMVTPVDGIHFIGE